MTFPLYGLCGVMDVVSGALRGVGATISSTIIMLLTVCLIRVIWVFFVFPSHSSIEELMACYPITWILCIISCTAYLIYKLKKTKGKCVSFS
jgi:Na+-driven multidrug efflux pump